jgi:electron transport complex protein RnfC
VPLHAPTSGTVTQIIEQPVPHPSGLPATCIILKPDNKDEWIKLNDAEDYRHMDPSALRNRIRDAGIVGLGGAGFPSFIKLNPGARTAIDELIINAAECEPYISCDDMLMRERAVDVIQGARIMKHALQARRCLIGIEDNKPEAQDALADALAKLGIDDIDIISIPTIYPAGGEKQLIKVLTGKESPTHGLPLDIGVVCQNVATAAAVYQAVVHNKPLISRIVTLTGNGINRPGNYELLIGTPVGEWIEHSGGYHDSTNRLVMGGPMMGFTLGTDNIPIIKTSNCILALGQGESGTNKQTPMPCIRCGACMDVCPANLLPQQLYWQAFARDFDKIQDYNLFDCIECGCCSYVCPSQIPLVQYYRFAKTEIWAQERDKKKSDRARLRHEFRLDRLEREKREREERMRKKKAALKKDKSTSGKDSKKDAIEAALARVRDKQQKSMAERKNIDNLTEEQQKKIDEIEMRRKKTSVNDAPENKDSAS